MAAFKGEGPGMGRSGHICMHSDTRPGWEAKVMSKLIETLLEIKSNHSKVTIPDVNTKTKAPTCFTGRLACFILKTHFHPGKGVAQLLAYFKARNKIY